MRRRTMILTTAGGALALAAGWIVAGPRTSAAGPIVNAVAVGPYPGSLIVDEATGHAFVGNQDGTIQVLSTRSGAVGRRVPVGSAYHSMAVAPALHRLVAVNIASSGVGGSVSTLDTRAGLLVRTVAMGVNPHGVAVDERAGRAYVGVNGGAAVFDARTGALLRTIRLPVRGVPVGVALDTRLGRLFVAQEGVMAAGLVPVQGGASTVSTIDAHSGAVMRTVKVGTEPYLSALDERVSRLFLVSVIDRKVDILDTRSGTVARTVPLAARQAVPDAIALDARAGRVILVASGNGHGGAGHVTMLDARTGATTSVTPLGQYPWSAAVDEGRARAYVAGNGGTYVLDTRTGVVKRSIGVVGGMAALDRRAQRLIVLGHLASRGSAPAWEQGLRRWAPWAPRATDQGSTVQAVTIDVSR